MKLALLVLVIAACHTQPRIVLSPDQRVQASLARWGTALEHDDQQALTKVEDQRGQLAFLYVAIKAAASHVPNGAEAVQVTAMSLVITFISEALWPTPAGGSKPSWDAIVPAGPIGPALVAAGLAQPSNNPGNVIVPMSLESTAGRLEEASKQHHAKLVEQRAWTCKLAAIEKAVSAADPTLVRGAAISPTIFGSWLEHVEQLWLVRADCASGPALVIVTARKDGNDRILLAKLF